MVVNPLSKLSYLQTVKSVQQLDKTELHEKNITILRNITIEPIEPYIQWFCSKQKVSTNCQFGDFNNIFQNSMDSLLVNEQTELVCIFYDFDFAFEDICNSKTVLDEKLIIEHLDSFKSFAQSIIDNLRSNTHAPIAWSSFIRPSYPQSGLLDSQPSIYSVSSFISKLNDILQHLAESHASVFVIDSEQILMRLGYDQFYDMNKRLSYAAPYTNYALQCFAQQLSTVIANNQGNMKKCLVLDCDNTLWGGVIGEQGLEGIELSNSLLGKQFLAFQQYALSLSNKGILLALCSKNNPEDVWQVFDNHNDMILTKDRISTSSINWNNKAQNITEIATSLNIGLESLVFVDDNPIECEFVKQSLPMVEVIQMKENPLNTIKDIITLGYFDNLTLNNEDRDKTAQYHAQEKRQQASKSITNIDDYLISLNTVVTLDKSPRIHSKRIAQLTQKTNQFNLTTKRLSEAEVEPWFIDHDKDIFTLSVSDKFGDLGIVGMAMLKYNHDTVEIVNLLFSCRALGRRLETLFLQLISTHAESNGCLYLNAFYKASSKNQQTEDFYTKHHFDIVKKIESGVKYSLSLKDKTIPDVAKLFTVTFNNS